MLKLKRARAKAAFNEKVFLDTEDRPIRNNWHHEQFFEAMELHKFVLLLAAREHAKTEIGVKCNALFEMGVDPNIRILIVSDIHEKAQDRTRLLRQHVERNAAYRAQFPHVHISKKEGDHAFTLARNRILKEPTVTSTYAGGAISGGRFDLIVCDDVINLLKNSYTQEQRRKLREWFYRDVMNSLARGGRLLMLGTPQHHEDLHSDIQRDKRFYVASYPGVDEQDTGFGHLGYRERNEARGITGDDAICLWPAMHDYKSHMAKKDGDYDTYLSQQQLQSVPSTGLVFRKSLMDAAFERGKSVTYNPHATQFVGIDPGYSQRASMLCIQERSGDRIELWKEHSFTQMPPEDVAQVVAEHCINHRVRVVFIDAEDAGFRASVRKALALRGYLSDRDHSAHNPAGTRVQGVPFSKYKQHAITTTRWLLKSDRVAWGAPTTMVHMPGRVREVPSLFRQEMLDWALKEGEDFLTMKGSDHGPDAFIAYVSRWIQAWAQATDQAA